MHACVHAPADVVWIHPRYKHGRSQSLVPWCHNRVSFLFVWFCCSLILQCDSLAAHVHTALYQKILELAEGIGQGAPNRAGGGGSGGGGGGGFGRNGGGGGSDEGIAQKGEALLAMLAELDITQQSYSQYLQALIMDVSALKQVQAGCWGVLWLLT